MNNTTACANSTLTDNLNPVEQSNAKIIILFSMIIGVPGNLLVILVYAAKKSNKITSTLFIMSLACSDFIICVMVMPSSLFLEIYDYCLPIYLGNLLLVHINLITTSQTFSSLVLTTLALDRYFCICYPLTKIMTPTRAKIILFILVVISVMVGCIWTAGVKLVPSSDNNYISLDEKYESPFFYIGNLVQTIIFIISLVSVIILYLLIYIKVSGTRIKRKMLKSGTQSSVENRPYMTFNKENDNQEQKISSNKEISPTETNIDDKCGLSQKNVLLDNAPIVKRSKLLNYFKRSKKKDNQKFRDATTRQNLKTAIMLSIITVLYTVFLFPAVLITRKVIKMNLAAYYMYFLNDAINPVIYGFMNPLFRADVNNFFQRCKRK